MSVWVLEEGIQWEGTNIYGVFSSKEAADAIASAIESEYEEWDEDKFTVVTEYEILA